MSLEHPVASRSLLKELLRAGAGGPLQDMGWRDSQHLHYLTHLVHLRGTESEKWGKRERGEVLVAQRP